MEIQFTWQKLALPEACPCDRVLVTRTIVLGTAACWALALEQAL
jgi:hypothetical protein